MYFQEALNGDKDEETDEGEKSEVDKKLDFT